MTVMSEMAHERIPALTLGWRLKMALGTMASHDMADALEVSRTTVSRWMADRGAPPRSVYVKQWALITRTNAEWLLAGRSQDPRTPGGSEVTRGYDAYPLKFARAA